MGTDVLKDHTAFIFRVKQFGPEDECTIRSLEMQFLPHQEQNICYRDHPISVIQ
jgi:hypothetical protein